MENIILYLLIASVIVATYAYLSTQVNFKTNDKLSHNQFLNILNKYDHVSSKGVCFGTSLTLARYYAHQDEQTIFDFFNLLRIHQNQLLSFFSNQNTLPKEIKSITRQIIKAQDPENHIDLFGKYLWQPDIEEMLQKQDEDDDPASLLLKKTIGFNSISECTYFLSRLATLMKRDSLSLLVSNIDHTIWLCFKDGNWLVLNTNTMFKQSKDIPYLEMNNLELAEYLFKNMSHGSGRGLILTLDFIGPRSMSLPFNLDWLNNHLPSALSVRYEEDDNMKVPIMWFSANWGDLDSVKEEIARGSNPFENYHTSGYSPIVGAIKNNRLDTLKYMLTKPKNTISQKRKTDGRNLLHIAAQAGASDCMEYLLSLNSIPVNGQDKDGFTPLMIACMCNINDHNTRMVELLIKSGALLDIKSKSNHDAEFYAQNNTDPAVSDKLNRFFQPSAMLSDTYPVRQYNMQ